MEMPYGLIWGLDNLALNVHLLKYECHSFSSDLDKRNREPDESTVVKTDDPISKLPICSSIGHCCWSLMVQEHNLG